MSFGSAIATCAYNNYFFSPRMEVVNFASRINYAADRRAVRSITYSITLKDQLLHATDTGAQMETTRALLTVPGQILTFTNQGFGNFTVNSLAGGVRDVDWGPKPQMLQWKPNGAQRACEFIWTVDVTIPPECVTNGIEIALLEFSYGLTFSIDASGYTKRTYSGELMIPATRQFGGRRLFQTADDYWESIQPAIPKGFRRTVRDRTILPSSSGFTFQIVDEEMGPNPWPEGVVDAKASASVEMGNLGGTIWRGKISAQYEMAKGVPTEKAAIAFVKLVKERLEWSKKHVESPDKKGPIVLTQGFILEEPDIYGRQMANFTFRYNLYTSFRSILKASGLWLPVTTNNYNQWAASLKDVLEPRGNAGLEMKASDQIIVDLCLGAGAIRYGNNLASGQSTRTLKTIDLGEPDCPAKEDSWLFYKMSITADSGDRVLEHKPLPTEERSLINFAPNVPPTASNLFQLETGKKSPDSIVQRINSNTNALILSGRALRVCYDIPCPSIAKVGDFDAIRANREGVEYFNTWQIGNWEKPVVAATFRQRFIIPNKATGQPATVGAPDFLRGDGRPLTPRQIRFFNWFQSLPR